MEKLTSINYPGKLCWDGSAMFVSFYGTLDLSFFLDDCSQPEKDLRQPRWFVNLVCFVYVCFLFPFVLGFNANISFVYNLRFFSISTSQHLLNSQLVCLFVKLYNVRKFEPSVRTFNVEFCEGLRGVQWINAAFACGVLVFLVGFLEPLPHCFVFVICCCFFFYTFSVFFISLGPIPFFVSWWPCRC